MNEPVLVMGWSLQDTDRYIALRRNRGDQLRLRARALGVEGLRGVSNDVRLILLGPYDLYARPSAVEEVAEAAWSRGMTVEWDSTDRLMGIER